MDTAQWPQDMFVKPMEDLISNTCSSSVITAATNNNIIKNNSDNNNNNSSSKTPSTSIERKVRPQKDQAVNCPRCNSTNTKFCYYNNYSLTQPRYFCKTCRRYWTEGGSLRNIPVGGGSRKNKRSSSSSSISPSVSKKISSHDLISSNPKIHTLHHQGQDLNLGFPQSQQHHHHHHPPQEFTSFSDYMQLPTLENTPKPQIQHSDASNNANAVTASHNNQLSALELLNGLTSSRGLTSYIPLQVVQDPNGVYSSGFPSLQDYKPSLSFSLDGLGNGYGNLQQQDETNNGRLLFPFEDLKQVSSNTSGDHNNNNNNNNNNNSANNHEEQHREQGDSASGYWSGMLGTGGSW